MIKVFIATYQYKEVMFFKWHLSMHKALLVLLVDTVVGQVDEVVAQLGWVVGVLVRRKPDQVLRMNSLESLMYLTRPSW